ncbi:MAG: hypothetical protein RLZZ522_1062 [Verrucomicrobiota bacterium]
MNPRQPLLSALAEITGTGHFHSAGTAPFFFPGLQVKGLDEIAFPLPAAQARELIALAEAAPFGMGTRTVLDESIRKCWQIDAASFSFKSPQWEKFLQQTLATIGADLGITGRISASPYKFLIYGKGGHFKAHKDTEKLDAMFGTLVIALPSQHEGGRLFIRHDGREYEVDFSREAHRHDFQHAAFFADCEHEVEPVRSGYRCCVVYNLRLDDGDPGLLNLSLTAQASALLPGLATLKQHQAGELRAVLLEHSYTEANLSLQNLKGNDQARAHALLAAAGEAGFTAHLALVTFHQMGELEGYDCDYSSRRRGRYHDHDDDPESGTMGEVYDESLTITNWRTACNRKVDLGTYHVSAEELITKEDFGQGDPDEQEAEGPTGNAGCTMDYWYRRAAVVLWSADDQEQILCRYNFGGACATLSTLAAAKATGPGSPFHRLATAIVATYLGGMPHYHARSLLDATKDPLYLLLSALAQTGSRELLVALLATLPSERFGLCDTSLWASLLKVFGPEPFDSALKAMLADGPAQHRRTLFQLLAALAARQDATRVLAIAPGLAALAPKPATRHYQRDPDPDPIGDPEEIQILLAASHLLKKPKDRQAVRAFLRADGTLPYLRHALGPALLERPSAKYLAVENSLATEIFTFATDLLATEVKRPLPPFPDWTRPCPPVVAAPASSAYPYFRRAAANKPDALSELAAFMAAPAAVTHDFRRPQGERSEIENFIRQHFLDLDFVTVRKGTPHTLACTKNDNSYHHALALRKKDQALLAKLTNLSREGPQRA